MCNVERLLFVIGNNIGSLFYLYSLIEAHTFTGESFTETATLVELRF